MSDQDLRELERKAQAGDQAAKARLADERLRRGLCPWCGGPGADHIDVVTEDVRTCCCDLTCSVLSGNGGVDWTRCDGTPRLHCLGCPAVRCRVTREDALAAARATCTSGCCS